MEQRPLTQDDYRSLERSYISREIAEAAGIYRIASLDGRELVGRKGPGDYNGIVFPYRRAGGAVTYRLRLDHPPLENGKPQHKYLTAPGDRNRAYFPPAPDDLRRDTQLPLVISEGEKKCLALWRMACETGDPAFLPISFPGVYGWRTTTGFETNHAGERVAEKGPTPDLDLMDWKGRRVTILFDANAATNPAVSRARRDLAADLAKRGAEVWIADLPLEEGINGCDDFLAKHGAAALAAIIEKARRYDWREHLLRGEKGKVLNNLENAALALEHAPEWYGVLAYDEFHMQHLARRPTPWGFSGIWDDNADLQLARWLQRRGIMVGDRIATNAAFQVARETSFHPVRDYLNGLTWDGEKRLDKWLTTYLGADDTPFHRGVGTAWMISAVARIYQPGCKADHMLVAEGPQGIFKSTAFRTLAGEWFSDDMPTLGTKDSQLAVMGTWVMELPEMDALNHAEWSHVKAFMSRSIDHFRPPYGRHMIRALRQCVFVGTINHATYLEDETGGRRFWPVRCGGEIAIAKLAGDRNQLWAEAVVYYRQGKPWWLDKSLDVVARAAQDERFQEDAWEDVVGSWLLRQPESFEVSISTLMRTVINKPEKDWKRADEMRLGKILRHLGWELAPGRERPRRYERKRL